MEDLSKEIKALKDSIMSLKKELSEKKQKLSELKNQQKIYITELVQELPQVIYDPE